MLLFVALERGTWAIVKIFCSALVALLLPLFLLYARKRRRHRAFHSKEQCLSQQVGSSRNVRLVEVKVQHPVETEETQRDAKVSKCEVEAYAFGFVHHAAAPEGTGHPSRQESEPVQLTVSELSRRAERRSTWPRVPGPRRAKNSDPDQVAHAATLPASGNADVSLPESAFRDRCSSLSDSTNLPASPACTEPMSPISEKGLSPISSTALSSWSSIERASLRRQGSWRKLCPDRPTAGPVHGVAPILKKQSGSKAGLHVKFDNRVNCRPVPHLEKFSQARKAAYWWQPDDFAEFLKVRIEIGKAYRLAARKLGVDIMKLSSVGTHGAIGYKTMIQQMPELANESRRGLGLGRKRQRAKNRDEYIATVLKEQKRQRDIAIEAGKLNPADGTASFELDSNAVSQAAERVSEKDRKYSVVLAMSYLKQAREEDKMNEETMAKSNAGETAGESPTSPDSGKYLKLHVIETALDAEEDDDGGDDTPLSFTEELRDDTTALLSPEMPKGASQMSSSKGFGLTRDHLAQKGLSATGHYISKNQRPKTTPVDNSHAGSLSDESDGDFTTDADDTDADGSLSGADCSDGDSVRVTFSRRRARTMLGRS